MAPAASRKARRQLMDAAALEGGGRQRLWRPAGARRRVPHKFVIISILALSFQCEPKRGSLILADSRC